MKVLLSVTVAIVLSACAVAEADEASRLPAVHGDAAGLLSVRCVDGDIQVDGDRVRTRPDGVHIRVEELPDDGTTVELANADASAAPLGGGRGGVGGIGVTVLDTIAPGPVLVRCFPDDGPRHFLTAHDDDTSVVVEVADEGGHWHSPGSWTCAPTGYLVFDYGGPPDVRSREQARQLVDAASTHLGVPPEAGYSAVRHQPARMATPGKRVMTMVSGAASSLDGSRFTTRSTSNPSHSSGSSSGPPW